MTDYSSVWREEQNIPMRDRIRADLYALDTVQLTLQPGDVTQYHLSLTPILNTMRYEISDDGREPGEVYLVQRPSGLIIVVLNEGFAERAGFVWGEYWLDGLGERMGIRNTCTTEAIIETIKAVWL